MTPTEWLDKYKLAWETQNPELIASLFTLDGKYFETPFNVYNGQDEIRAYWKEAPGNQRDINFGYKILKEFDNFAFVHWTSKFISKSGDPVNLDGIFYLEFDPAGLCLNLKEWWHVKGEC